MSDFRLGNPPPLETSGAKYASYQDVETIKAEDSVFPWFSYFIRWVVFLGILFGLVYFGWVFFQDEPTSTSLPQALSIRNHEKIIGKKGGEVQLSDGASIVIPEGALDRDILVSMEKITEGRVTDLYHMQPDFVRFIKPVLVSIPYHAENLSIEETPFEITLYTGETKNRLQISHATSVNPVDEFVRTELMEF